MDYTIKEKEISCYPKPVTIEQTSIILYQMKHCICKIYKGNGTGFLCILPYNNIKLLITNYHIINNKYIKNNKAIKITFNDDTEERDILLTENRKIFFDKENDTTIIEIKDNDNIKHFLELDDKLFNSHSELFYENNSIYVLHYPKLNKSSVSYGLIKKFNDNNINHTCNTESGSSGSPILNLANNKVIGIHKESSLKYNFNIATFLKVPLNKFMNESQNYTNNTEYNKNQIYSDVELINKFEKIEKKIFQYFKKRFNLEITGNETKLDLNNKNIIDSELKLLCKIRFNNLEELNLSYNNISDFESIKYLKNIKSIDLSYNNIDSVKSYTEILKNNIKIQKINLFNNKMNNKEIFNDICLLVPNNFAFLNFGIKRLVNEFYDIYMNNKLANLGYIFYLPKQTNIFEWIGSIKGPINTSYNNGLFFFKVLFPENYPIKGPQIYFLTPILHTNIVNRDKGPGLEIGFACIKPSGILNFWNPETTMIKVFIELYNFLNGNCCPHSPEIDLDLVNEYFNDNKSFEKKVKYFTKKYADPIISSKLLNYNNDWAMQGIKLD